MRYTLHFSNAKQYFVHLETPVDRQEQMLQLQAWVLALKDSLSKVLNETITEPRGFLILLNKEVTDDDLKTALEKTWAATAQRSVFSYKKWEFPFYKSAETSHDLEDYFKGDTQAIAAYWEAFLSHILKVLSDAKVNVVDLINKSRGDIAYNLIDVNASPTSDLLGQLRTLPGVINVRLLSGACA